MLPRFRAAPRQVPSPRVVAACAREPSRPRLIRGAPPPPRAFVAGEERRVVRGLDK